MQISSKTPSSHPRELMSMAPDTIPLISNPIPLAHSRQDTVLGNNRWPEYYDRRRPSYMARSMPPASVNMNMNPVPNSTLNADRLFQSDRSQATASNTAPRPLTTFGATVNPYPEHDNLQSHPFERLATPDTISHHPSHTT